jgi:hypothetical protein
MQMNRRFAAVTALVFIATVLTAGTAGAEDKNTHIKLALDQNLNGVVVIKVQPRDAKIWRDTPNKPNRVEWWWMVNDTSYPEIFWEIRYDPAKGGGTGDYFGNVDIECGQTDIVVEPDKKPDAPKAQWPYSITVYACRGGVKAQKIATIDPRIIWQD